MVDYEIINRIKATLIRKGISQRELAVRIGKDETVVSRWLAGKVGIGGQSIKWRRDMMSMASSGAVRWISASASRIWKAVPVSTCIMPTWATP